MRRAVFLDRDGTINVEKNHIYKVEDWEWMPDSIKAIKALNQKGFLVFVITNQSGVARGLYSESHVVTLHEFVNKELERHGAKIDEFYYCPHHPDFTGECDCRKPKTRMVMKAQEKYNLNLKKSYVIGDKLCDMKTGISIGATPILVRTGHGEDTLVQIKNSKDMIMSQTVVVAKSLYEATKTIVNGGLG